MNATPSPAIEAVELPKPYDEWTAYAKRAGLLDESGVAPQDCRMSTQTAFYAYSAAWNRIYPLLAAKQEDVDRMREALTNVCKLFPTDTDMAEAGWTAAEIEAACRVYDKARAALSPTQGEAHE